MPTDEELQSFSQPTSFESNLESFGCFASLLLPIAVLVILKPWHYVSVGTVIIGSALFIPACAAAVMYLVNIPYNLRTYSARMELNRRYPVSTKTGLNSTLAALRRANPDAEWIVLIHQSYLPHGGIRYVNVRVNIQGEAAIQSIQAPFAWRFLSKPTKHEAECSKEVNQQISALLPIALKCGNETISSQVRDGSPSVMLGWSRTANRTFKLSCNSAAMHARELEKPNVKLLLLLANDSPLNLDQSHNR